MNMGDCRGTSGRRQGEEGGRAGRGRPRGCWGRCASRLRRSAARLHRPAARPPPPTTTAAAPHHEGQQQRDGEADAKAQHALRLVQRRGLLHLLQQRLLLLRLLVDQAQPALGPLQPLHFAFCWRRRRAAQGRRAVGAFGACALDSGGQRSRQRVIKQRAGRSVRETRAANAVRSALRLRTFRRAQRGAGVVEVGRGGELVCRRQAEAESNVAAAAAPAAARCPFLHSHLAANWGRRDPCPRIHGISNLPKHRFTSWDRSETACQPGPLLALSHCKKPHL